MLDPPGFALENFDAVGRWRAVDERFTAVDASGVLPDGTKFVSSTNWSCVPTTDNDVHCSSTPKTMPVGKYTEMTITMHIPASVAKAAKCSVVNVVNASISAAVPLTQTRASRRDRYPRKALTSAARSSAMVSRPRWPSG